MKAQRSTMARVRCHHNRIIIDDEFIGPRLADTEATHAVYFWLVRSLPTLERNALLRCIDREARKILDNPWAPQRAGLDPTEGDEDDD